MKLRYFPKFILLLIFLGLILYSNTLKNALFWDDDDNIKNNVYIRNFQYLPQLFTANQIAGSGQLSNQYRPLLMLSYSLEYHLFGLWPSIYHFDNMLLHIANAILVFLFIKQIMKTGGRSKGSQDECHRRASERADIMSSNKYSASETSPPKKTLSSELKQILGNAPARTRGVQDPQIKIMIPSIASLLFLIHPFQTEAVDYIAGRTDLLTTFFMLIGLILYLKNKSIIAVTLSFIAALLSKETAIVFPLLIIALVPLRKKTRTELAHIPLHILLWSLSFIYILLRLTVFNFMNSLNFYDTANIYTSHMAYRIFTFLSTIPLYFKLILFPRDLYAERFVSVYTSPFYPLPFLGLIITSLLLVLTVFAWQKNRIISFAFIWIFINMILNSNIIVPVNAMMTEHWIYTPSVGIFLLISLLFMRILPNKNMLILVIVVIVLPLSLRTFLRNRDWHDPITFYEQTLRFSPNSARVHNNLAMAYADRGNEVKAISEFKKAISISDVYPQTHYNLGNSYRAVGDVDDAIAEYKKSLQINPRFLYAYRPLIDLLTQKGLKEEAGRFDYLFQKNINPP